jgi:hypothetical protein
LIYPFPKQDKSKSVKNLVGGHPIEQFQHEKSKKPPAIKNA